MAATAGASLASRRHRLPRAGTTDALTRLGVAVLALLVAIAVLGPVLPLGDPNGIGTAHRLAAPSWHLLAGGDSLGRSMLPRLAQAIRTTFLVAGAAVALTAVVSVVLGIVAAYYRGIVGEVIVRLADILFAFPSVLLALLVVAVIGPGQASAVVSIALISGPMMVRVVRAAALRAVGRDFVMAARVGGAGSVRILAVHVLPNVAGAAVVQGTYALSVGMLIESALSFLGLGVQPPTASLGSLVYQGSIYLSIAPWLVLIPGLLLALAITAVNLVGDGLRDRLDVRALEVRR